MSNNLPFKTINIDTYKSDYHDTALENTILVDVREEEEYKTGHIPGAINLPLSEVEERYDELPQDKTILLVCRTGGRSSMAVEYLAMRGYTNLINVNGGTLGWVERHYPIEK